MSSNCSSCSLVLACFCIVAKTNAWGLNSPSPPPEEPTQSPPTEIESQAATETATDSAPETPPEATLTEETPAATVDAATEAHVEPEPAVEAEASPEIKHEAPKGWNSKDERVPVEGLGLASAEGDLEALQNLVYAATAKMG